MLSRHVQIHHGSIFLAPFVEFEPLSRLWELMQVPYSWQRLGPWGKLAKGWNSEQTMDKDSQDKYSTNPEHGDRDTALKRRGGHESDLGRISMASTGRTSLQRLGE